MLPSKLLPLSPPMKERDESTYFFFTRFCVSGEAWFLYLFMDLLGAALLHGSALMASLPNCSYFLGPYSLPSSSSSLSTALKHPCQFLKTLRPCELGPTSYWAQLVQDILRQLQEFLLFLMWNEGQCWVPHAACSSWKQGSQLEP